MHIILEPGDSVTVHLLREDGDDIGASIFIGQGMPGKAHMTITKKDQVEEIVICDGTIQLPESR